MWEGDQTTDKKKLGFLSPAMGFLQNRDCHKKNHCFASQTQDFLSLSCYHKHVCALEL